MESRDFSSDFSADDLSGIITEAYKNALSNLGHCNILIIGKTGVGKSTLINAVFREPLAQTGEGYPVTTDIRQYRKNNFPLTVYDSPGLELDGKQLNRITQDVSKLIGDQLYNIKEQIHVVWYCINHNSNRLEDLEKEWLISLASQNNIPVVIVVTQTLTRKDSDFIKWLKKENLPVRQIIPVLAQPKEIDDDYIIKQHGLDTLVQVTLELLPEAAQKAFVNATKSVQLKARKASQYVAGYVTGAAAIGASPIPWSDAPALAMAQIGMLTHITVIFGLPVDQGFMVTIVSSLAGAGGATLIGRSIVTNLLKMIPVVGTLGGAIIAASTASALTLAIGLAYIEALKRYMNAKFKGQDMSLTELSEIVLEEYKDYAKSGRKTLKNDDGREEPRDIPIS